MKTYNELKALITQRGVHTVFGEPGEGWFIEQNPAELAEFLVAMQDLGVTSVLEVGTGWRAGLARFLHDDLGWRVTSVDTTHYGHQFGGIQFLHPDDFTYDAAFGVPAEKYDLVLLDADHTYEGVKDQHEFYAPYATKVVAYHDIAGLRDCEGVRDYWNEVSGSHDGNKLRSGYYEIIADGDQRGGIGYIVLAEVEAPAIQDSTRHPYDRTPLALDYPDRDSLPKPPPEPPAKKPAPRKPAAKKPAATSKPKAPIKK